MFSLKWSLQNNQTPFLSPFSFSVGNKWGTCVFLSLVFFHPVYYTQLPRVTILCTIICHCFSFNKNTTKTKHNQTVYEGLGESRLILQALAGIKFYLSSEMAQVGFSCRVTAAGMYMSFVTHRSPNRNCIIGTQRLPASCGLDTGLVLQI